ncbi:hypothetical protein PPMP20_15555 [Paraburkholderia phymatum]|nr:hypothetical protein [Paraburkholderia phymatum]
MAISGTCFFEALAAQPGLQIDTMSDAARVESCELRREADALALR